VNLLESKGDRCHAFEGWKQLGDAYVAKPVPPQVKGDGYLLLEDA
jgi:hypothetical protein